MEKGKSVDQRNNMFARTGVLTSFSSMSGAAYKEHYRDLLEGSEMKCLPEEYKYYLGDGSESKIGNQNNNTNKSGNNNGPGALDLFNTPNKFAKPGKQYSYSKK